MIHLCRPSISQDAKRRLQSDLFRKLVLPLRPVSMVEKISFTKSVQLSSLSLALRCTELTKLLQLDFAVLC